MSVCIACGVEVVWKRVPGSGRKQCFELDGVTVHWDGCSKRRWEQTKATGVRFEGKRDLVGNKVDGYADSVHGTKFSHILAKHVTRPVKPIVPCGRDRGECPQPPWETCQQACPNAIVRKAA